MLELVPITLKEANAFVERYHRHHKPVWGMRTAVPPALAQLHINGLMSMP